MEQSGLGLFCLKKVMKVVYTITDYKLTHMEQSDLGLHCFEYVILVRLYIKLKEFRQI